MMPGDDALLLHLPCTETVGGLLADTSPAAAHAFLPENVEIRPDVDVGRALAFLSGAGSVEVSLAKRPEWGLTVALWIRVDAAAAAGESVSILQVPIPAATHAAPDCVFGLYLAAGKLHARIGQQPAGLTGKVIAAEKWHHVALTWGSSSKSVTYFLDGKPLPAVVDGQVVEAVDTGIGVLNYPNAAVSLLLGANAAGSETFSGRMNSIRLYGRPLSAAEMAALVHEEKHERSHPFDHHHPLSFRVADDRGDPSVSIVDDTSPGRTLHLILRNASPIAIELPASLWRTGGRQGLVGTHRPTGDDHHLEVVFRPGTLALKDVAHIAPVDTDWQLRGGQNEDGTLSLYLSRPDGLVIPPDGVITIALSNVKAIVVGGSRPTQVELRYRQLRYLGDERPLGGHRLAHLDVVNRRGRSDCPFAAGFIGSNTVLNDGRTRNTLTLYLGNPALEALSFEPGGLQVPPRLLLSFDSGQLTETDEPWALGHADEVAEIEITASELGWIIHERTESETPEWVIMPPGRELQSNQWINFTLYPIVTRSPSGFTNLHLRYQNIDGFRDGEILLPIQKAPRLYRQQPVPASNGPFVDADARRSVHAFADSVVIGNGYAGAAADDDPSPPSFPEPNSLLVEGSVGIGVKQPEGKLHVDGTLRVGGDYYGAGHLWLHAFEGDGNSGTAYVQARDLSQASSLALQLRTQDQGGIVDALRLTPEGDAIIRGDILDRNGPVVPIGTIVMWSNYQGRGIPAGWALCDGSNDTPDLRGRFIVGSGSGTYTHGEPFDFPPLNPEGQRVTGQTGGRLRVALSETEMPHHRHGGTTARDGGHWHHVPVWLDGGRHTHSQYPPGNGYQLKNLDQIHGEHTPDLGPTTSAFESEHEHSFLTDAVGGDRSHENLPPYYVLVFIMKVS